MEKEMRYWYKGTEIIRYEYGEWGKGDEITSVLKSLMWYDKIKL